MTSAKPAFPEHQQWVRQQQRKDSHAFKIATPDLFIATLNKNKEDPEIISALFFQSATPGQLIQTTSSFLIDSGNVAYQPLKDIDRIKLSYDPAKILGLASGIALTPGANFAYDLQKYIPVSPSPNVYWDGGNANIIIELDNLAADQKVEVRFLQQGKQINDIII